MNKTLWECLLEMGLAHYNGGDRQIKRIARDNVKKVARVSRPVLMGIAKADKPGLVTMKTLGNLEDR